MLLATAVGLPFAFVIVMTLIEHLVEAVSWQQRFMKVGWDTCVLALGVAGGVFSNPGVVATYKPEGAVVLGLFSVVLSLGAAATIANLRKRNPNAANPNAAWKAVCALALGGAAVAYPAYLAFNL